MPDFVPVTQMPPKPGLLRREIGIALVIKMILLTGLWLLIFRWPDKPAAPPDIAARFALPGVPAPINHAVPTQPVKESRYVR